MAGRWGGLALTRRRSYSVSWSKCSTRAWLESRACLSPRTENLIVEEYFYGFDRDEAHQLRSVTKSVSSLITGIALDQGLMPGVETPIAEFVPRTCQEARLERSQAEHAVETPPLDELRSQGRRLEGSVRSRTCHWKPQPIGSTTLSHFQWSRLPESTSPIAGGA